MLTVETGQLLAAASLNSRTNPVMVSLRAKMIDLIDTAYLDGYAQALLEIRKEFENG